jgi:agmatine deiminase
LKRRLPAEWEAQDGILLAWPHEQTDWAQTLSEVEAVYFAVIRALIRYERVVLVVADSNQVAEKLLAAGIGLNQIRLHQVPSNDTWARDFGPITVMEGEHPHLLDFRFNGWGGKFDARLDNAITGELARLGTFDAPVFSIDLVLEGGAIESDGAGTLLTTTACLLNPNRNPDLSRAAVEVKLQEYFGVQRVLWLAHGYLAGDDTDSHIDTLARLAPHDTILYQACSDPEDEHFAALQAMAVALQTMRTVSGQPYRLQALPWPRACYDEGGNRLPATYANFLVVNGAVLVPVYNDPADAAALATIGEAFPDREIIGVDCRALIRQHGSLHCITMHLPRGVLR